MTSSNGFGLRHSHKTFFFLFHPDTRGQHEPFEDRPPGKLPVTARLLHAVRVLLIMRNEITEEVDDG